MTEPSRYRPEIDGLRAIAVLAVICFHADISGFSGGYVGVDIFFVISGFLITTIIVDDLSTGTFSYPGFIIRRSRRILPALILMLTVSVLLAYLILLPSDLKQFGLSLSATTGFMSNIFFWRVSDYFSTANELTPLLHTWSLSVEEQFYLCFPLFMLLSFRFGWKYTFWAVILIFLTSIVLSEIGWRQQRTANFFLPVTRAWELMLGCGAALWQHRNIHRSNSFLAALGMLLIGGSIVLFDTQTPTPSLHTLLPTTGALLLILFATENNAVGKFLSFRPMVNLGLISYSTYLWHQPLFAFYRNYTQAGLEFATKIGLIICSILLGFVSWRFIERRFRAGRFSKKNDKSFLIGCFSFLFALTVVGLSMNFFAGMPWRYDSVIVAADKAQNERSPLRDKCHLAASDVTSNKLKNIKEHCILRSEGTLDTAILGDSHAAAIAYPAMVELKKNGITSIAITVSGCLPFSHYSTTQYDCAPANRLILEFLQSMGIRTVILAGRYTNIFHTEGFDNGAGGVEYGVSPTPIYHDSHVSTLGDMTTSGRVFLKNGVELWLKNGFNVVIVYPVPEAGWHVPKKVIKLKLENKYDGFLGVEKNLFIDRTKDVNGSLDKVYDSRLRRVRPAKFLCDQHVKGYCTNSHGGKLFYYDDDHLSFYGASLFAGEIARLVTELRE